MKRGKFPPDARIAASFMRAVDKGYADFGGQCMTSETQARMVAFALLQTASGYSCHHNMVEILIHLRLAEFNLDDMKGCFLTRYGTRCILAAHERLLHGGTKQ
jgi:hypothetical protein